MRTVDRNSPEKIKERHWVRKWEQTVMDLLANCMKLFNLNVNKWLILQKRLTLKPAVKFKILILVEKNQIEYTTFLVYQKRVKRVASILWQIP